MLKDFDSRLIKNLELGTIIQPVVWDYSENIITLNGNCENTVSYIMIGFEDYIFSTLADNFPTMWASSAYKGANYPSASTSEVRHYETNNRNWITTKQVNGENNIKYKRSFSESREKVQKRFPRNHHHRMAALRPFGRSLWNTPNRDGFYDAPNANCSQRPLSRYGNDTETSWKASWMSRIQRRWSQSSEQHVYLQRVPNLSDLSKWSTKSVFPNWCRVREKSSFDGLGEPIQPEVQHFSELVGFLVLQAKNSESQVPPRNASVRSTADDTVRSNRKRSQVSRSLCQK